jgi:hypothetical protein
MNILEIGVIILIIVAPIVAGLRYGREGGSLSGILKRMNNYRSFSYIVGGILLVFVLIYYFFLR